MEIFDSTFRLAHISALVTLASRAAACWLPPVAYRPLQTNNEFMFDRYSERARQVIAITRWLAEARSGSYIEPEDLLRALIREDRGESPSLLTEMFPGLPVPSEQPTIGHRPFFDDNVATDLLQELQDEASGLSPEARDTTRQPVPRVDMPISHSLAHVLELVANARRDDTETIEPLHLLAAIVESRGSGLAQLLRDHGITRQKVEDALDSAT